MSSPLKGVPIDHGPMDVDDSILAPASAASGDGAPDTQKVSAESVNNPEQVGGGAASGAGVGKVSGSEGNVPFPPVVSVSTERDFIRNADAPADVDADSSEKPKLPETANVPLPPGFDLDIYISRYSGYTKLRRLDWISKRCPALAPECYLAALSILRNGLNTSAYRDISMRASGLMGQEYAVDTEWVEQTDRRYQQSQDRLDAELNSYKTNLIKESIRMGYNELGNLNYRRGDLEQALKWYARTRDYCTTNRHSAEMCLHVIEISADMGNFVLMNSYTLKAKHTPDLKPVVMAKLRAAAGLVCLESREYAKAARKFVDVTSELGSSFDGVLAPEDVAMYGGLCALATFSRDEMKQRVLDNASFKNFLDLVPQMRALITDFVNSRYKTCLTCLASIKGELQLDIYLHTHVDNLYKMVEDKCLMQYVSPYTSVRLASMAESFGWEVSQIENKVADLIISNQISARIDSTDSTLHAKITDQISATYSKMLEVGDTYRRELRAVLVRMSCVEHDFVVRNDHGLTSLSPSGNSGSVGSSGDVLRDAVMGKTVEAYGEGERPGDGLREIEAIGSRGSNMAGVQEDTGEDAGGPDAERPSEAGGGASSISAALDDVMDTVE